MITLRDYLPIAIVATLFPFLPVGGQVSINTTGDNPDDSAMLDITSTDKGLLVPRITNAQRDVIMAPATGLMIYNTDASAFNFFDGDAWGVIGSGAETIVGPDLTGITSITGPIPSEAAAARLDAANTTSNTSVAVTAGKRQTITALQTGTLHSIELEFTTAGSNGDLTIELYRGNFADGPITGPLLHTQVLTDVGGDWQPVVLNAEVGVQAGQVYTMQVYHTGNVAWKVKNDGADVYAGGRANTGVAHDFVFRFYVRPPASVVELNTSTGDLQLGNGPLTLTTAGDFIFGSDQMDWTGGTEGSRMFFNQTKSAFRAGADDNGAWDDANVGLYSAAMGYSTVASGDSSFAMGTLSSALGDGSFAVGTEASAVGEESFAAGNNVVAGGHRSLALGKNSTASARASVVIGDNAQAGDLVIDLGAGPVTLPGEAAGAVAIGFNVTSQGLGAFAIGQDTTAQGTLSFALGNQAFTEGENAFAVGNRAEAYGARAVAAGDRVKAYGDGSVAMGLRNNAQSFAEFVVGSYTPDYVPQSTTAWNAADRLFVVGNGPDSANRSTALIVHKSGDTTLGGQLTLTNGTSSITLPNTDGLEGQVLATDGLGNMDWVNHLGAQTLSLSGSDLTLSDGGGTVSINDADSSSSNEIQTLSQSSGTVTLSHGGGSVSVPWTVSGNNIFSTNSGNVGIHTNSAPEELTVEGDIQISQLDQQSGRTGDPLNVVGTEIRALEFYYRPRNKPMAKISAINYYPGSGSGWFSFDDRIDAGLSLYVANSAVLSEAMTITNLGRVGIGTNTPTQKLDVDGTARIRGGAPLAGKILTATSSTGDSTWKYPALNNNTAFNTTGSSVIGSTTGWQNATTNATALADLEVGDRVMIMVSCRVRVGGTAGSDDYTFRVGQSGTVTFGSNNPTGLLEHLDQHRNQWQDLHFHRVTTVTAVPGTGVLGIFDLQVEMTNADDTIEFDDIEITAIKL